ncbi:CRAL-TRIO domain-containing protein [Fimicolochytrium jonesii]|uniref:CRAL-TRIO domain-containing protein n=1 Tax=Fimicolochytrium jonesii TaxID=1396493 RepID=UPI0022FE83D2|nr:CRAL-TRIO domain-containing protein [Fimicolochytrium jonesii]KAI8825618.1 CRAL-TRIO domain-containing protein [Fimicolochytrium jonesii]
MSKSTLDLNNLTPSQKSIALSSLRSLLTSQPPSPATTYDDPTLLRFLIARQMNAPKALQMINEYVDWREKEGIDQLAVPGVRGEPVMNGVRGFEGVGDADWEVGNVPEEWRGWYGSLGRSQRESMMGDGENLTAGQPGGGCFHKTDKEGQPVFIERTGYHDVKSLATKCPQSQMLDWHVRNTEMLFNVLMPECSAKSGRLIEKHTVIFDCANSGMWQFSMKGMQLLKSVSELDSKVYPERLGRLFIVNTPGMFTRTWSIVKRWLDKRILEKIFILDSNYQATLLEYIDAANLPEFLGGTCKCSHMPNGKAEKRRDIVQSEWT